MQNSRYSTADVSPASDAARGMARPHHGAILKLAAAGTSATSAVTSLRRPPRAPGPAFSFGAPVGLTAGDRRRIEALGIRRIVDFRSIEEARVSPQPGRSRATSRCSTGPIRTPDDYSDLMRADATRELDELMRRYYREMPYRFTAAYAALFAALVAGPHRSRFIVRPARTAPASLRRYCCRSWVCRARS